MPYLTPQELPEDDDCRPLSIPADSEWLALFGGALTELTKVWNWQYSGGLTVDETVTKMTEIIENWYSVPCTACTTPGGYRVIRISLAGILEQLDENGDWVQTTDEYVIPPPNAREGEEQDIKCLAAKNATNVLHELYDSLALSFDNELELAEAITAFIAAFVAAVGFAIAPITWAIAAFMLVVFAALYEALEFITADLWNSDFSDNFTCILLNCAEVNDGVVTFNWDCVNNAIEQQVDTLGLTDEQLRLFIQIGYILYFIGGADGLNLAGGTNAITDDDCEFCEEGWCYEWDFTLAAGDWYAYDDGVTVYGTYVAGVGWQSADLGTAYALLLGIDISPSNSLRSIDLTYELSGVGGSDSNASFWYDGSGFNQLSGSQTLEAGEHFETLFDNTTTIDLPNVFINPNGLGSHTVTVKRVRIRGDFGTNPFGESNC